MAKMEMRSEWLWIILLCVSCAQVRNPQGGPRDTTGPILVNSSPLPMSTGFNGSWVELEFDEYIQLVNVREQVLISPPLSEDPDIELKGNKRIFIDFGEQELERNRTYSIQFGDAIVDFNERNPLVENTFLFSTGDYIDSLSLSGQVVSARFKDTCEDCMVILADAGPDSTIYQEKPLYITRTGSDGRFRLDHLRSEAYRIYAFKDMDADLLVDDRESLAFLLEMVTPSYADSTTIELLLFTPDQTYDQVKTYDWALDGTRLDLVSGTRDTLPSSSGPSMENVVAIQELGGRMDSVRYWFDPPLTGGSSVFVGEGLEQDTIRLGRTVELETVDRWIEDPMIPNPTAQLELEFFVPMQVLDTSLIHLQWADSMKVHPDWMIEQKPFFSIATSYAWPMGSAMDLIIEPGAFTDIYGRVNDDTLMYGLDVPEPDDFGLLSLDISVPDDSLGHVIAFLDSQRLPLETLMTQEDTIWVLKDLEPGTYYLTSFRDEDGDGEWTTGNIQNGRLPEPVMEPRPIQIRANWELESKVILAY